MTKHIFRPAVWVAMVFLCGMALSEDKSARDEAGFKSLFNGKDLTGWDGDPRFWSVKDGAITGQTTADNPTEMNTFLIWKDGKVDDFELRLSYRLVGGNSGIQYRSDHIGETYSGRLERRALPGKELSKWVVGGYQGDFEAGDTHSGILYEERGRGILATRGSKVVVQADGKKKGAGSVGDSAEIQSKIKKEDWNEYTIIAKGNHLTHKINGMTTIDVVDEQSEKAATSGILALQLHAGPPMLVQFKDVRIKKLSGDAGK